MPIFQNSTVPLNLTLSAIPATIYVRLALWNQSIGKNGSYVNYTGVVEGNYTVKVDFIDDTARNCFEYYAKNVTLVFNETTGPILPVDYVLFKQKSTDPTKVMAIRISGPQYSGGWPYAAAMPYGTSNTQKVIVHQNQVTNKQTKLTVAVSYNIPERAVLCPSTVALMDSIGKVTGKSSTGSYVSECVCVCVCVL
jgi:hypothetical protein